ncbi:ATP synthase F1 subunit gamma [Candidatus Saccharibacteria bacterium]|nr:ATP synthase F1 subunit gamma [Candidatus Saccharibacteria bacterium]
MAQTKIIQRRIRSVKNAKQITKALEVVAASRMRRVVEAVARSRTYGNLSAAIMRRIATSYEAKTHPYFAPSSDKPTLYIVMTSDRGQAGAFNSNVFNLALDDFKADKARPQVLVFGRKGARFFAQLAGIDLVGAYEDIADIPEANVFSPVLDLIADAVNEGKTGTVKVIYTEFLSPLSQRTTSFQLLPIDVPTEAENQLPKEIAYEFEPEIGDVLDEGIKLYFEAHLMQAKIEAAASEHAMRMVAMGNANRNASDLIDDLTLELNATRQAAITQEIAEITGGAAAISQ